MSDEVSEPSEELTESQRMDLVIITRSLNGPESVYLVEVLDAAGVPAISENDNALGFNGQQGASNIRVPRVLLEKAREVAAWARAKASDQRVKDAFDPEIVAGNAATHDPESEPVMTLMFQLREQPYEFREMELRKHVWKWLINRVTTLQMATYLAAAGLKQDQAAAIVDTVAKERATELEEARQDRQRSSQSRKRVIIKIMISVAVALGIVLSGIIVVVIVLGILGVFSIFFTPW